MKKILLLDGQTIQAITIAECLKKFGHYTILFCESKQSYGYRTKFADKKIISPSTHTETAKFHLFLLSFLKEEPVDVIIPMNDYSAEYLSQNKNILGTFAKFIIPDIDIFMRGYDKGQLMQVCKEYQFPHPKTADITISTIEVATQYVGFPAIIKPNITTGARGFVIVHSTTEVKNKLPEIIKNYGACHLQQYIAGGGNQYKVEIFIYEGALINSTVIHKIRFYPEKGGSSCFNQTVENKELVSICFDVLSTISWTGFADFDLIEDPQDGVIKIMEINPRVPACVKACINANVNFVENIVNASLGQLPQSYLYKPGNYLRYFSLDLLWFLKSNNRFKSKPTWFKALFSSKQSFQDGSFQDIKPFIFGTVGGLIKQFNPRFRAEKKGMN